MMTDGNPSKNTRRGRLAEQAYEHLKGLLVTGRAKSDEWFAIEEIASQMEMSRQPVMDALRRLSIEGFVDIVPQVGCRPRKPSLQEVRDFFHLYSEGEALIAALAAERADGDDILRMQLISAQIGALARRRDSAGSVDDMYRVLNRRLHSEMRRATRSPSVAEIVESLSDRSDFFVTFSSSKVFSPNLEFAHEQHEEIIDAIADHDVERARRTMKNHIMTIEQRLEGSLSES